MSARDIQAERAAADFFDVVRPPPKDRGPLWPRLKTFGGAVLTGYAIGSMVRRILN
jgi:hypothetical protein